MAHRTLWVVGCLLFSAFSWGNGTQLVKLRIPSTQAAAPVYSEPGWDWQKCRVVKEETGKDSCGEELRIGTLRPSVQVEVVMENGKPVHPAKSVLNYYEQDVRKDWVKVKFNYFYEDKGWGKSGEGWIDRKYLDADQLRALEKIKSSPRAEMVEEDDEVIQSRPKKSTKAKGICLPKHPNAKEARESQNFEEIAKAFHREPGSGLDDVTNTVFDLVGKCKISLPDAHLERLNSTRPVYDQVVLGDFYGKRLRLEDLKKQLPDFSEAELRQKLVDADVLARTLYSEMGSCWEDGKGKHYLEAVAKLALNRVDYGYKNEELSFQNPKLHDKRKSPLAQVLTKPSQFQVWDAKSQGTVQSNLKQALCPPSSPESYWRVVNGRPAKTPKFEQKLWKDVVRIATEAVFYTERFKKRTSGVTELFYTSGEDHQNFMCLKQSRGVRVEGRVLDDADCLNLFKGKPIDTKSASQCNRGT